MDMELVELDRLKRWYGLIITNVMFHWTLCDLPTISEGYCTFDYNDLFKSWDISQVLYVHDEYIDLPKTSSIENKSKSEIDNQK